MKIYLSFLFAFGFATGLLAQAGDSLPGAASLQHCVQYALQHQPLIQQSLLDEAITERQIQTRLADWYPQLNFNYSLQHNFQVQTTIIGGNLVRLGVNNTSAGQLSLTQTLFNRDVLLAKRSADDVRKQVKQATSGNKIDIAVNVSKAFYNVLLTHQQIRLDEETISRLEKSLKNAQEQYNGGLVDKIDYKRATIALNNARAQQKDDQDNLEARYASLRSQMGYPAGKLLELVYDSLQLQQEAFIDTTQAINYENRIEYQLLQTRKRLQASNLDYYKWGYLPSVNLFGNYNLNFLNNDFGQLYSRNFPNSLAGIALAFPIFQGGKRIQQIRQAALQLKKVDYDIEALQNNISASYARALASYKSSLTYYTLIKENLSIATGVYNTVQLQYKEGVKTYLDVIFAETDLRSAQVNSTNALYQVISSKLDVQKELGNIPY